MTVVDSTDKPFDPIKSDLNDIANVELDNYYLYEYKDKQGSIQLLVNKSKSDEYLLYNNNKLIFKSRLKQSYLDLWKYLLKQVINPLKESRILILGGGDQLLSNYLIRYPCNITIVDPLAYHYHQPDIKATLKVKDFVSKTDPLDLLPRKMVPINMSLKEAIEDEILTNEEFDLILVDNFQESLLYSTGMYDADIPNLYFNLLKKNGNLIINNRYGIPKHIDKKYNKAPKDIMEIAKGLRDYYNEYKTSLNSKLNLIDHITKGTTSIELYRKNYKNTLEILHESS